jgi:hypothetical protein
LKARTLNSKSVQIPQSTESARRRMRPRWRETPKGTEDGATGSSLNGNQEVLSQALFYRCSFYR